MFFWFSQESLGVIWGAFGSTWRALGVTWVSLGLTWGHLESLGGDLGSPGSDLDVIWGSLGAVSYTHLTLPTILRV